MLNANKLGALGVLIADLTRETVADLSPTAAALLLTLHHRGSMTASALADVAGVTQPTAVRVIGGLTARGLVARGDRLGKTAPLHLTPAGTRRAEAVQRSRLAALERLLEPLPRPGRDTLGRLLDTILAGATTSRRFARTTCRLCDHSICDGAACPIGTRAGEIERALGDADTEGGDSHAARTRRQAPDR